MDEIAGQTVNFEFDNFKLDCTNAQLFKSGELHNLTPKAFSVLTQLVQARGALVRKDALFDTVWAGTVVSESALTVCIREIRKVLGDSSRTPKYIETVHKRGYRFIATVDELNKDSTNKKITGDKVDERHKLLINRHHELEQLDQALSLAAQGHRQIVFITGEAGIGKTNLIEACKQQFSEKKNLRCMHGQCVEHHGMVEPYFPWLDAMTNLCYQDKSIIETFKRCSPMWLLHTPSLLSKQEREELEISLAGTNGERMLREMVNVLHELSSMSPLVIFLDNLHFSDAASLELLSCIAHRPEQAKLLIIATYRPVERFESPPVNEIKQDLMVRDLCSELPLRPFSKQNIKDYIDVIFPKNQLTVDLIEAIYNSTEGNPLFVMNVIRHLTQSNQLIQIDDCWKINCDLNQVVGCIPENIIQMIGSHIEKLEPQIRKILQVAAVASDVNTKDGQFCVAEIAYALDKDPVEIEIQCDKLVEEGHLLYSVESGKWPDGTLLIRYCFNHGLYQKAFYKHIVPAKRAVLHRRLGERLAKAYSGCDDQIALNLAIHFEQGRNYELATRYLKKSAETAFQRGLNSEAIQYLNTALELSMLITEDKVRMTMEMEIHTCLATVLITDKGNDAPEVEKNFLKARRLGELLGDKIKMFPAVFGLRSCCLFSARLDQAHRLSRELIELAENIADEDLLVEAHVAMASTSHFLGDSNKTLEHAKYAIEIYSSDRHAFHIANYGLDPGVYCRGRAAHSLWTLGYPDQALQWAKDCLVSAKEIDNPYNMAFALNKCAWIHLLRNEPKRAKKWASRALDISSCHGYKFFVTWANVIHGWSQVAQAEVNSGLKLIKESVQTSVPMADGVRSYLLTVLANACYIGKEYSEGINTLNEIVGGAENFFQAERHHLRGILLLKLFSTQHEQDSKEVAIAQAYLKKALQCAREQSAKSYELRAATSLAELMQVRGQYTEATNLLEPITNWFTEGQTSIEYTKAKTLLQSLTQQQCHNAA